MLKCLFLSFAKIIMLVSILFFTVMAQAQLQIQEDELVFDDIIDTPEAANSGVPSSEDFSQLAAANNDGFITVENKTLSEVDVEKIYNVSLPYKQRRSENGVLFSVGSEQFYPLDYVSQFKDVYIEDILDGKQISLLSFELGYKRNISLGSIGLLFGYSNGKGMGSVLGVDRQLELTRQSLSANFAADSFFNEPWIVPYVQGGIHSFNVLESSTPQSGYVSRSASTGISYNYRAGMLFQLNWIEKAIDPTTQAEGLRSSGLENTYIDIYMADHASLGEHYGINSADGEGVPNLSSGLQVGVALKLEF